MASTRRAKIADIEQMAVIGPPGPRDRAKYRKFIDKISIKLPIVLRPKMYQLIG